MRKLTLIVAIALTPFSVLANTQTHHVYIHKAGIDTSIYQVQSPDIVGATREGVQEGLAFGAAIKAKREAKKAEQRQSQYTSDLIQSTNGLKEISPDTISPLIQKYPEKTDQLLELLQR